MAWMEAHRKNHKLQAQTCIIRPWSLFSRFFDAKIIPTQKGGFYAVKYEFDDIKNIYFYYADPRHSKNGINFNIHPVV